VTGVVPQLAGETVVVIGGTSGLGLATARRARDEDADVILTAPCVGARADATTARNPAVTGATSDVDGGQQLVGG
jgi:NAD(P)-dependent dehydrogenase (short-subunit alcohol dehydrogenase family)